LSRKRKPRKNTTKNWIPKELRTSSQTVPEQPELEEVEEPEGVLQIYSPRGTTASQSELSEPEQLGIVLCEPVGAQITSQVADATAQQTPPTSPPPTRKCLVKKITPRRDRGLVLRRTSINCSEEPVCCCRQTSVVVVVVLSVSFSLLLLSPNFRISFCCTIPTSAPTSASSSVVLIQLVLSPNRMN
jgi:hypothetical protein